ncbi:hypothetical protein [Nostoc cycadae]|uniref:hypothetical protein n=1 Tax=Nostoc cycadae TaxID=246795 RepID=UPI001C9D8921|nr:hypothetical protein [Nostoc cycadae]
MKSRKVYQQPLSKPLSVSERGFDVTKNTFQTTSYRMYLSAGDRTSPSFISKSAKVSTNVVIIFTLLLNLLGNCFPKSAIIP